MKHGTNSSESIMLTKGSTLITPRSGRRVRAVLYYILHIILVVGVVVVVPGLKP